MTDRELLALMAASISPHIDASNSSLTLEHLAVNRARDILAEVDHQLAQRPKDREALGQ
jgi:hypothetical protein